MVEFRFKQANCVALGTFNVYIIQPKLLVEMGVLPDGWIGELAADGTQPGIRFQDQRLTWNVRPERLAVESTEATTDCGHAISVMLERLSWTPIMAVGSNTLFTAEIACEKDLSEVFRPPTTQIGETEQRTCHAKFRRETRIINIHLAAMSDRIELALNVHDDFAAERSKLSQAQLNHQARAACDAFMEHRRLAVEIATHLTNGTFFYE